MIKRKKIFSILIGLAVVALVFSSRAAWASTLDSDDAPWFIPICQTITLPTEALSDIDNAASAQEAITNAVASFAQGECQCDDALNLTVMFIEDAIRRGTTLDAPANGVFYRDLLQISANMAGNISGSALMALSDADINPTRQLRANISFVSDEPGALDISFPDDVAGIYFDNITIETEFAALTLNRDFVSGSALRIERGLPMATGGYAFIAVPAAYANDNDFELSRLLDFWAIGVVVIIMVIWGVLASMGKKLRLWVVPALAVIAIAANVWTLGLNQEGPDSVIYAPAPVYFYSVAVTMPDDMSANLSIPLGGHDPQMLMLVNEQGELMFSRYNPFTDTIDAIIYTGGTYSLQEIDIRG